MARVSLRNGNGSRSAQASRYDAHHTVLSETYGVLADLRRELADSRAAVTRREELLKNFANCADSQRAWLLLEDYFEKLSLSRKDFPTTDWWPRLLATQGTGRLQEMAFLFLRSKRSLPTELAAHADLDRFAKVEQAEQEGQVAKQLEAWLFPSAPASLDSPRASLRVVCEAQADPQQAGLRRLAVQFYLLRPRTGEKLKTARHLMELTTRAAHAQEQFAPADWEFIDWLAGVGAPSSGIGGQTATQESRADSEETLMLSDLELLHWLARWGDRPRLELRSLGGYKASGGGVAGSHWNCQAGSLTHALEFHGQVAELTPHLENRDGELVFTHRLTSPGGKAYSLNEIQFFSGCPPLALVGHTFYLLRNAPPAQLLEHWANRPAVPV